MFSIVICCIEMGFSDSRYALEDVTKKAFVFKIITPLEIGFRSDNTPPIRIYRSGGTSVDYNG